jgi:DNA-binding NarL/FixJ family response regulator
VWRFLEPAVERKMVRVLLADDHTLTRTGLRALLEKSAGVQVVGEAADGREAVKLAKKFTPDLVLMDLALPELNGIEAAQQIRKEVPQARILMVTMYAQRQYVLRALAAGASGYLLKNAAFAELLAAIQTVHAGRKYVSPPLADALSGDLGDHGPEGSEETGLESLTKREREVLQLVGDGRTSQEIARRLYISIRTVEKHRQNIMAKLDIHSIAGLTKFAILHGLCFTEGGDIPE